MTLVKHAVRPRGCSVRNTVLVCFISFVILLFFQSLSRQINTPLGTEWQRAVKITKAVALRKFSLSLFHRSHQFYRSNRAGLISISSMSYARPKKNCCQYLSQHYLQSNGFEIQQSDSYIAICLRISFSTSYFRIISLLVRYVRRLFLIARNWIMYVPDFNFWSWM